MFNLEWPQAMDNIKKNALGCLTKKKATQNWLNDNRVHSRIHPFASLCFFLSVFLAFLETMQTIQTIKHLFPWRPESLTALPFFWMHLTQDALFHLTPFHLHRFALSITTLYFTCHCSRWSIISLPCPTIGPIQPPPPQSDVIFFLYNVGSISVEGSVV